MQDIVDLVFSRRHKVVKMFAVNYITIFYEKTLSFEIQHAKTAQTLFRFLFSTVVI